MENNLDNIKPCHGGIPAGHCIGKGYSLRKSHHCPEKQFWEKKEAEQLCNCCEACENSCREES